MDRPAFIANAVGCLIVIAGLSRDRTWAVSALAGVAISVLALAGLIVSYGAGLFGWQESRLSVAIGIAVACECGAVIALSAGLLAAATSPGVVTTSGSGADEVVDARRSDHRAARLRPAQ